MNSVIAITIADDTTPITKPDCWRAASRHQEAGLQVLRRRAGVGGGDAHDRADHSATAW